ncbi:MAG TPA: hypothetical protein VMC09_04360 [Anaerolineales bacterium]|nr:hypothetical protein [Anaerolineales bacterium]
MCQRIRYSTSFGVALFFLLVLTVSCAQKLQPTQAANSAKATLPAATFTPEISTETPAGIPVTDTPNPGSSTWPAYNLATTLPDSPAQVHLYRQAYPAPLPGGERLAALMKKLQITGTVSTSVGEDGGSMMSITGDAVDMRLWSDDPLILVISYASKTPQSSTPEKTLPPDVRAQTARTFLDARGLLDFPYIMEPPRLSREQDQSIRIVPLLEGYPLYDYDPLNGRLLVSFDSAGEISMVIWRPLKVVPGESVDIKSAAVAWDQLVNGKMPKKQGIGQCWQAMVFDPGEADAVAGIANFDSACVNWGGGENRPYAAATIDDVELVYFASDLSLGTSPFAYPADSPARIVFPMWQFSGNTSDQRELIVLWPAIP